MQTIKVNVLEKSIVDISFMKKTKRMTKIDGMVVLQKYDSGNIILYSKTKIKVRNTSLFNFSEITSQTKPYGMNYSYKIEGNSLFLYLLGKNRDYDYNREIRSFRKRTELKSRFKEYLNWVEVKQ